MNTSFKISQRYVWDLRFSQVLESTDRYTKALVRVAEWQEAAIALDLHRSK
jgi:hypothetical protein